MAIRFDVGAEARPGELAGRFLVLVREATPTDAALAGLDAARTALSELGPAVLSPVVRSPAGALLRVGRLDLGEEALRSVPGVVATALEHHGVVDADVELLEAAGPVDRLDRTPNAVVLRLFPEPAGSDGQIPLTWLEVASEWVLGDAIAHELVAVRLLGASFEVPGGDAAAFLREAAAARAWCDLVHGRFEQRIRTASLTFGHAPHLTLAAGGPGCDAKALVARFALLGEVARDVGATYACVDLEDTFGGVGTGLVGATGWPADGGAAANAVVAQAGDVVVPDAFPFQILGPGHLDRLGAGGADLDGEPLDDGRVVVALGDPHDWLPRSERRAEAADRARRALEALLVTDAQLDELVRQRQIGPIDHGPDAGPLTGGGPDLEPVVLDALPHTRRGLRLTLLELAAWLGHEPHSDVPRSVSPVLAAYARWYASGLDHGERQQLKPYAARLVGTRGPGRAEAPWRPLGALDEARAWRAADWLAREQAAAWLRVAGHPAIAGKLEKVRRRNDGGHRVRQLALLEAALAELVSTGADASSDESWDAWERASETSAWVAASEAAWTGVPDVVASAVELRAVEAAQGATVDGAATGGLGDAMREAARRAAAADAWSVAGEAAAAAGDARATDPATPEQVAAVPMPVAWDRALQGAASRLGLSRDELDQAIEVADGAARALLADLMEGGDPPEGAFLVAQRAAAASAGGAAWRTVVDLAAGVVGEATWRAAETTAADVVDRVVRWAPALAERAVLVALAREVGGLAARTAAARGGPTALEPALDELRPAARRLLDALLDTR